MMQSSILRPSDRHGDLIIGASYCGFTHAAIQALPQARVVMLDKTRDGRAIRSILEQETMQHTIPFIFRNGLFVGGFSDI